MDSLNQIEKQLEDRSVKELYEIVNTFITSLDELSAKYHTSNVYYNIVDKKYDRGTMCLDKVDVRYHLLYLSLIHISEPTRPY